MPRVSVRGSAVPQLRPEWVHQLARDFPHLRVTLNGGVTSVAEVRRLQEECLSRRREQLGRPAAGERDARGEGFLAEGTVLADDIAPGDGIIDGVMAGRWPLRNPLALWDLRSTGCGGRRSIADAIADYESYAWRTLDRRESSVGELAMPLILLAEAMRDAASCEGDWEEDREQVQAFDALWQAAETMAHHTSGRKGGGQSHRSGGGPSEGRSFRLLSKMLSKASGAKVSKKFVRNRSEDLGVESVLNE